jgi:hypothetical protein
LFKKDGFVTNVAINPLPGRKAMFVNRLIPKWMPATNKEKTVGIPFNVSLNLKPHGKESYVKPF